MKSKILIIEDELALQNIIAAYFKKEGFLVDTANNGLEGLEKFKQGNYSLLCIDIMMPIINGWDVLKSIRQTSNVPVILMTALSDEENQLKGYGLEADDYVTKPFSPSILIAKAKNLLKRSSDNLGPKSTFSTSIGDLTIHENAHTATVNGDQLDLSKTEFDLLVYLIKNDGIALDRSKILDNVWGIDAFVEERVVDTFIKTLRKKLGHCSKYIETVFGYGYKFNSNA